MDNEKKYLHENALGMSFVVFISIVFKTSFAAKRRPINWIGIRVSLSLVPIKNRIL